MLGTPCIVDRLYAGDYSFLNRDSKLVGIERCEIGNFIQKIRSGELEYQLIKCQEIYDNIILLIEGVYDQVDRLLATYKLGNRGYFRVHVYPHTEFGFISAVIVRLAELGIETLYSPNYTCTLTLVETIYNQRTKPEEQHTLFKKTKAIRIPTKLTNNQAVPKLMTLIPRLSERVAIRLINRFGSIWNILHAEDLELLEVDGFGRGLLDKMKREVGSL